MSQAQTSVTADKDETVIQQQPPPAEQQQQEENGASSDLLAAGSRVIDELCIGKEGEEEDDDDDTISPVSPSATVVPSNTPVTADSGQGSPTMQSSSESLSDDLAGSDQVLAGEDLAAATETATVEQTSDEPVLPSGGQEEEVGQGEATAAAASSVKEAKKQERKEEKKKQKKREDKGIEYILRALNSLQTPEEKLAALCKKFADLNEEHRVLQTSFKTQQRTMTMVMREKDALQAEHTRAMMAKSKLESLCRELQKHNKLIKEESVKRAKEDDEKRKEISAQFNTTIGEIQTQMTENTERNTKLRQENENLASQLKAFINSIELRDQQVDKLQKHHDLEKQLFEAKMKQAEAILSEQSEKGNKERELVMLKLAESNKKNAMLEAQVNMFKERYAEFEQLHSRSSETFQKYKTEMDKMTKRIKKLEKDGLQWKTKWEKSNKALIEQVEARSKSEKETLTYAQKANKLESLCRALQAELHNKKPPGESEDAAESSEATSAQQVPSSSSSSAPPNSPEASSPDDGSSSTCSGGQQQQQQSDGSEPQPSTVEGEDVIKSGALPSCSAAVSSEGAVSSTSAEEESPSISELPSGDASSVSTTEGQSAESSKEAMAS